MQRVRRERPALGVLWSEVWTDGKAKGGAGFAAGIEPDALKANPRIATVAHADGLNVGVALHSLNQELIVLAGESSHRSRTVFVLPADGWHDGGTAELAVRLTGAEILSAQLNGIELSVKSSSTDGADGGW